MRRMQFTSRLMKAQVCDNPDTSIWLFCRESVSQLVYVERSILEWILGKTSVFSLCCLGRHLEFVSGPHGNRFTGTFMMTMSQDDEPETISSMAQRLSRVHGLRMTPRHHTQQSQSVHSLHPQGVTQPPLPAVIQNLLGPETSDGLQFNTS